MNSSMASILYSNPYSLSSHSSSGHSLSTIKANCDYTPNDFSRNYANYVFRFVVEVHKMIDAHPSIIIQTFMHGLRLIG